MDMCHIQVSTEKLYATITTGVCVITSILGLLSAWLYVIQNPSRLEEIGKSVFKRNKIW